MAQPKISEAVSLLQAGYTSAVQQGLIYKNHPLAIQWASLILRFSNKGDATRRELNQLTATMNAGAQEKPDQNAVFSISAREFFEKTGALPFDESDLDLTIAEFIKKRFSLVTEEPENEAEQLAQASTQAAGAVDDLSAALKQTGLPEIPEIPEQDLGKSEPDSNPAQQDQNQAQLFQTEDAAAVNTELPQPENNGAGLNPETLATLANSQVRTIIAKFPDLNGIMAVLGIENNPDYTAEQKAAAIRAEAKKRLQ